MTVTDKINLVKPTMQYIIKTNYEMKSQKQWNSVMNRPRWFEIKIHFSIASYRFMVSNVVKVFNSRVKLLSRVKHL